MLGHCTNGIVGPTNIGEGGVCRSDISMVGERRGTIPTELLDQQTPVAEGYVGPTIPWWAGSVMKYRWCCVGPTFSC